MVKGTLEIIDEYWKQKGKLQMTLCSNVRILYSKEAFVDAITKFIISDDQVHTNFNVDEGT